MPLSFPYNKDCRKQKPVSRPLDNHRQVAYRGLCSYHFHIINTAESEKQSVDPIDNHRQVAYN